MRAAICACSCALTVPGGVYSALSHPRCAPGSEAVRIATARLRTAHQMGTVLESASGMRLPARVESTRMNLGSSQSVSEALLTTLPRGVPMVLHYDGQEV